MALLNRDRFGRHKGTHARTTPGAIARNNLAQTILALRREDVTYPEIARRLSVDGSATITEARCRELADNELRRLIKPDAEALRRQHLDRLDRLYNRAAKIAMSDKGDRIPALQAALKALERESTLMGLDAPRQTEIKDTTPRDIAPATVQDVVAQLAEEARLDLAKRGIEYDPATGAERPIAGPA